MAGKLICIEGVDGTGKTTQYDLLRLRLQQDGVAVKAISFPRYNEDSSVLLRAYLNGEYGTNPNDVNPYAASAFFAVDRLASYLSDWRTCYEQGGSVLSYRYTTANAVHQAAKLPPEQVLPFCDWLFEYEYNKLGLPKPDAVFFLDMDEQSSRRLLDGRTGAHDIHEANEAYRIRCRTCGLTVAEQYGWHVIHCAPDGVLREVNDIHEQLYALVRERLSIKE